MANTTVTVPSKLAALIKERQKKARLPTLDAAAAALIADGLLMRRLDEDHSAGLSKRALRALLDEAEASGPAQPWDPATVRREIRRAAARPRKNKGR
jgi:hypothetical protein